MFTSFCMDIFEIDYTVHISCFALFNLKILKFKNGNNIRDKNKNKSNHRYNN